MTWLGIVVAFVVLQVVFYLLGRRAEDARLRGARVTCCAWHLLTKPKGWRGHATWCKCGTLLILRDGVWIAT